MDKIDFNEQLIVFVVYHGNTGWYVSDKEIWFLDYKKRIDAYQRVGYEINEEYIDERRRDLLYLDESNIQVFINRIKEDRFSCLELNKLWKEDGAEPLFEGDYRPSLYVNFDDHIIYSMYSEPASYEDYAPNGWDAQYQNFLKKIPSQECYWLM